MTTADSDPAGSGGTNSGPAGLRAAHASDDRPRPDPGLIAELRRSAEELARSAGMVALAGRRSNTPPSVGDGSIETKSSTTDLVTEFDRAAEDEIVGWLKRHRSDDAIVGEEGTALDGTSGLEWHIDPIDGTTNFVYDQPAWACSVGVRDGERTLAGAVFAPVLGELFSAGLGQGATLNGVPISATELDDLSLALIGTGFSFDASRRVEQGAVVTRLLGQVRDIRRLGSAALDLCFVACGRLDGYFETGLNSWDMLAGELIAIEAGAVSSAFDGGPPRSRELLVAGPAIHASISQALTNAIQDNELPDNE